jgi:hypothetical protein
MKIKFNTCKFKTENFPIRDSIFMETVLNDPRSWGVIFKLSQDSKPDIVVKLVGKSDITRLFPSEPHLHGLSVCDSRTNPVRIYMCAENWMCPPAASRYRDIYSYRTYLVLHEFGHALGHGHAECPGKGLPAPVMMQQTLGTGECYPDPWVKKM